MPYRPHQQRVMSLVRKLRDLPGLYLYHALGSGKSFLLIGIIETLRLANPSLSHARVLVITKRSLVESFKNELAKAKQSVEPNLNPDLYYVTTFHKLYHSINDFDMNNPNPFILAIDEAHTLRNATSKIYPTIFKLASHAAKVLLLSATPIVNYPHELGSQLNLILANATRQLLTTSDWTTDAPFLPTTKAGWKKWFGESGLGSPALLARYVGCLLSSHEEDVTSDEYKQHYGTCVVQDLEIPMTEQHEQLYIDLMHNRPDSINRVYEPASRDNEHWKTWSSFSPQEIRQFHSQLSACNTKQDHRFLSYMMGLRMACNMMYKMPEETIDPANVMSAAATDAFYAPKFQVVMGRIYLNWRSSSTYKAVVYTNFIGSGVDICRYYLRRAGIPFEVIDGQCKSTPQEIFKRTQRFNQNKTRVLIFTAAGCHGLEFKFASEAYIMDLHWNYERIRQAVGRVHRYDSLTPGATIRVFICYATRKSKKPTADTFLKKFCAKKTETNASFLTWIRNNCVETKSMDYLHKWLVAMRKQKSSRSTSALISSNSKRLKIN